MHTYSYYIKLKKWIIATHLVCYCIQKPKSSTNEWKLQDLFNLKKNELHIIKFSLFSKIVEFHEQNDVWAIKNCKLFLINNPE